MIRRCRKCKRLKLRRAFRWSDSGGQAGYTGRCSACRRGSHKHGPLWLGEPRYWIRPHAVHRYIERVNPGLTFNKARLEMLELMKDAPLVSERPVWVTGPVHPAYRGMLVINDKLVFCLRGYRSWRPGHEWVKVSTVLVPEVAGAGH